MLLEVLCPEDKLSSLLLKMRLTALEDVAKISFGCLYPKCPNSASLIYWLALHFLVNKSSNYYSLKHSLRDFFFAARSYSEKNFFCFLKLGGEGWGSDLSNLEGKENVKVKIPE